MFDEKDLRPTHCVTTVEKLLWNINENLAAMRESLEPKVKTYSCNTCGAPFDKPILLAQHTAKEHPANPK